MDGGGRLLGSVNAGGAAALVANGPAFGFPSLFQSRRWLAFTSARQTVRSRSRRAARPGFFTRSWLGPVLCLTVLGSTLLYGSNLGGQYATVGATYGAPQDVVARAGGFGIEAISISGLSQLAESEVLEAAGISGKSSLLFLDAADVRNKL